jgi:REP element-mobilizing transposase RayT
MVLNPFGRVVATYWQRLPSHFPRVQLGVWVVMPNHVHGIIIITNNGDDDDGDDVCRGEATPRASMLAKMRGDAETPGPAEPGGGCLAPVTVSHIDGKGEATPQTSLPAEMRGDAKTPGLEEPGGGCLAPTPTGPEMTMATSNGAPPGSVGAIVGNIKSTITRRINQMRHASGAAVWQRGYWERVVRSPEEHARIEDYILLNPARWQADDLHPDAPPNPFNQECE